MGNFLQFSYLGNNLQIPQQRPEQNARQARRAIEIVLVEVLMFVKLV